MGNSGARLLGMEQAPVTVEESINGVTKLVSEILGVLRLWDCQLSSRPVGTDYKFFLPILDR